MSLPLKDFSLPHKKSSFFRIFPNSITPGQRLIEAIDGLIKTIDNLKTGVITLKSEVSSLKTEVTTLGTDMNNRFENLELRMYVELDHSYSKQSLLF